MMNPSNRPAYRPTFSRRELLIKTGLGFGSVALAGILHSESLLGAVPEVSYQDLRPRPGHFPGTAKAVIHLMQSGGPSQADLFDPKPELQKRGGQPHPDGVEIHQPNNKNVLFPSPFEFSKYGESGMDFSSMLPNLATLADELCMVRSMYSEHNNHPEGQNLLYSCRIFPGRPVMGAWISYALGTENQNLPAYVVLRAPEGYPDGGKQGWRSGWLPALFQGVEFSSSGTPVRNLDRDEPLPPGVQQRSLQFLNKINTLHQRDHPRESELDARIRNYELAARMQLSAAEALDISKESETTRKMYGLDNPVMADLGTRCLMARRLVEAGVRFVQIFPEKGMPWDHHKQLKKSMTRICAKTDQPAMALIKDLKSRGLLDTTIVMWCGEFGRLPTTQNSDGRDHNRNAFTLLLTGGGFKKGLIYGATDEFGYKAVANRVSVPSLHATILHALGIDHTRLTYQHGGRVETPTDVSVTGAKMVGDILMKPSQA